MPLGGVGKICIFSITKLYHKKLHTYGKGFSVLDERKLQFFLDSYLLFKIFIVFVAFEPTLHLSFNLLYLWYYLL